MVWTVFYRVNHSGNEYVVGVTDSEMIAEVYVDSCNGEGQNYCTWFYKEGRFEK